MRYLWVPTDFRRTQNSTMYLNTYMFEVNHFKLYIHYMEPLQCSISMAHHPQLWCPVARELSCWYRSALFRGSSAAAEAAPSAAEAVQQKQCRSSSSRSSSISRSSAAAAAAAASVLREDKNLILCFFPIIFDSTSSSFEVKILSVCFARRWNFSFFPGEKVVPHFHTDGDEYICAMSIFGKIQ